MSFQGDIRAQCPAGCEEFDARVWTFINGDASPELRDILLARECNLLLCEFCDKPFFPEESYVYLEASAELLVFVFPESFRKLKSHWESKMKADFALMHTVLGGRLPVDIEPQIAFGTAELADLLQAEDFRSEEREVMEAVAAGLGLGLYRVRPEFARRNGVPRCLPIALDGGGAPNRERVLAGLKRVVAANEKLETYARYLVEFSASADGALPPAELSKP